MNNYELTIILDPNLKEEEISGFLEKISSIVAKHMGEIIETNKWGLRRFAYPIRKQEKGYYIFLRLVATVKLVRELEKNLKLANDVLRFMFISTEFSKASEQK